MARGPLLAAQFAAATVEYRDMRTLRSRAIARRLLVVVPLALLAAGVTLAFGAPQAEAPLPAPAVAAPAPVVPIVVVPDLRWQAYVFARGILLDKGFAWTVDGAVQGYAANIVVKQTPRPGTRLVDTGAPTIHLLLRVNPHAPELGNPMSGSTYSGTTVVTPAAFAAAARKQAAEERLRAAEEERQVRAAVRAAAVEAAAAVRTATAAVKAALNRQYGAVPRGDGKESRGTKRAAARWAAPANRAALAKRVVPLRRTAAPTLARPPAFAVAGAPREPLEELPLPTRAALLARWIALRLPLTAANRHHFLYQHAWVVTGARFGWWHGAEALRTLVAADRRLERQWRLAAARRVEAERALVEVQSHSVGSGQAAPVPGDPRNPSRAAASVRGSSRQSSVVPGTSR